MSGGNGVMYLSCSKKSECEPRFYILPKWLLSIKTADKLSLTGKKPETLMPLSPSLGFTRELSIGQLERRQQDWQSILNTYLHVELRG